MLPSVLPRLATDSAVRVFPGFGNFSLFKTPFPGQGSLPGTELPRYLLCLFSRLSYFFYLFLKTMICFSGCLMSSASIQKLLCRIYSALKCSFDEFVEEKVVSLSYSSATLAILVFWMLGLKPAFLLSSFNFIKRFLVPPCFLP